MNGMNNFPFIKWHWSTIPVWALPLMEMAERVVWFFNWLT